MRSYFLNIGSAFAFGIWTLLSGPQLCAESSKLTAEETDFFETHIRPTLVVECIECHGPEKQKGGLRLDSRAGWQKGGDSGPSIVPKDPEGSLLLRSIKHLEPDLKMPEKAPKLDDSILENFTRWIAMGAPDPRDKATDGGPSKASWPEIFASRKTWWSLQPLRSPVEPPYASQGQTSRNSIAGTTTHAIDRFLNSALTQAGLTPEPPASAEVLARRLHFLLVGLPPSPDEVRTFTVAHALDHKRAVRERVEKLLASPSFGERWARHWMDLVRYAESHGSEGDPEIPSAYQYRDYLIRAFNADVPLDQLIREHLAGDLLQAPRISPNGINESRIGPAHLRMCEHGYQPVDSLDDQMKAVDNQIDVVTKAFQALTVSCARCHDHKFDAISQRDYTALYGIFSSIRPAQLPIQTDQQLQLSKKTELEALKNIIRSELSKAWLEQLQTLPSLLSQLAQPEVDKSLKELQDRLAEVNKTLAEKQWSQITAGSPKRSPAPYAIWNFTSDGEDKMGRVRSELQGGANIKDGALALDGKGAFLRTEPLPTDITERTFEAWLSTPNLDQRGGGIIGIEQLKAHAFDTVVFAEKQRRKWLAGSNNHRRTEQSEGAEESADSSEIIHVAISYAADGTIAVFQNGKPYGKPFRKDSLHTYPSGDSRLLIGLRHTGAGNGFFAGNIYEARLYTRALSAEDIAASYAGGMLSKSGTSPAKAPPGTSTMEIDALNAEAYKLRAEIAERKPASARPSFKSATASPENPLHLASRAVNGDAKSFAAALNEYGVRMKAKIQEASTFNAERFGEGWDLSDPTKSNWFTSGPDVSHIKRGDFRVEREGNNAILSLLPAGLAASTQVPQFGGVAMSPEFRIATKNISVRMAAANGAVLRVICDNYPLGANSIFPRALVQRRDSAWSVLDTEYRLNTSSYLEMSTPSHQTRRAEPPKGVPLGNPSDSFFVLEKVFFHDGKEAPKEVHPGLALVLARCSNPTPEGYLSDLGRCLVETVMAWRDGTLNEPQRNLLDSAVQSGLLSTNTTLTPNLDKAVTSYRTITQAMPTPTFVPGVLEHQARDAAFLPRGDHKKPGDPVPRGFLEALDSRPINARESGRLELADRILADTNPLTARVMANRIWLWTFGAGLVPTPDNFGRMGEKPTHPELLDFLAAKLRTNGWSLKSTLLYLTESDAFQRASTTSEAAIKIDPLNALLSHAHVRRLEAEAIRDALLSVSGRLDPTLFGPSVAVAVPRRSIYLQQRRNSLPAILTTFDAPRPFTTLGRRDTTTVPAQSLTLLNDPAVIQLARFWGESIRAKHFSLEEQINAMFEAAFGRAPSREEVQKAEALLSSSGSPESLTPLAHALFNLKEFIYLR
jgi:cytochrome c553